MRVSKSVSVASVDCVARLNWPPWPIPGCPDAFRSIPHLHRCRTEHWCQAPRTTWADIDLPAGEGSIVWNAEHTGAGGVDALFSACGV